MQVRLRKLGEDAGQGPKPRAGRRPSGGEVFGAAVSQCAYITDCASQPLSLLLEEYRISLFAQEIGTKVKVSEKRLAELWREVG